VARRVKAKHGFTAWAVLVYAFLYLPILVMVIFAFNKPSAPALAAFHGSNICGIPPAQIGNITVWNGFTSCWFSAGLHDPTYVPAIVVSLQIAALASIISTLLGLGAALALARMKPRLRAPFDVLVYLTLVVPEIVIAVASLIFFVQARSCSARWCSTPRWPCSSSGPGSSGWATRSKRPPMTSARGRWRRSAR
jgi:ABC-type spermidine/putrescine transport system permease subunit II